MPPSWHSQVAAARLAAGLAGIGFVEVIAHLAPSLIFVDDEWDFILENRGWNPTLLLQPHNEHWSSVPILLYRLLFAVFGLSSYAPYLIALALSYAACGILLFELIRVRVGIGAALYSELLFLCLGRGAENSLWAFQIGWMLALALGILAMLLLHEPSASARRLTLASAVLLLSVMSSGIGLVLWIALFVELAVDRERRRSLIVFGAPLAAYALWENSFGSHALHVHIDFFLEVQYVRIGVESAVTGAVGMPLPYGDALLSGLVILVAAVGLLNGLVGSRIWGAAAGLVSQFVLFGTVRTQFGAAQATAPRYVTTGTIFVLLILLPTLFSRNGGVARRMRHPWVILLLGMIPVILNFEFFANSFQERADIATQIKAELATVSAFEQAPDLSGRALLDRHLPRVTTASYLAAVHDLGSPVGHPIPGDLSRLPARYVDNTLNRVFGPSIHVLKTHAAIVNPAACARSDQGHVAMAVGAARIVTFQVEGPSRVTLWLGAYSYDGSPIGAIDLKSDDRGALLLPDTGGLVGWSTELRAVPPVPLVVCTGAAE